MSTQNAHTQLKGPPTAVYTVVWINHETHQRGYYPVPLEYESARAMVEGKNKLHAPNIQYAECSPGELAHFKRPIPGYRQTWK